MQIIQNNEPCGTAANLSPATPRSAYDKKVKHLLGTLQQSRKVIYSPRQHLMTSLTLSITLFLTTSSHLLPYLHFFNKGKDLQKSVNHSTPSSFQTTYCVFCKCGMIPQEAKNKKHMILYLKIV